MRCPPAFELIEQQAVAVHLDYHMYTEKGMKLWKKDEVRSALLLKQIALVRCLIYAGCCASLAEREYADRESTKSPDPLK
jgi:hypothetical protein